MFPDDLSVIFCLYAFLLDNPPSLFVNIFFCFTICCVLMHQSDSSGQIISYNHADSSLIFISFCLLILLVDARTHNG